MNIIIHLFNCFILFFIINDVSCFPQNENVNQNDAEFYYQLTRIGDITSPGKYNSCMTPFNEPGHCKNIAYCRRPELQSVWAIIGHLCVIENKSIGICCPNNFQSASVPQIASLEELHMDVFLNRFNRNCGLTTKIFPQVTVSRFVEPDEWPWMAALLKPTHPRFFCGGVLITDRHVLTAAHCIYDEDISNITVRLGEYSKTQTDDTRSQDFTIKKSTIHEEFDIYTYENDIAVLEINKPSIFTTYIWPICLPPTGLTYEGESAIVIGWGLNSISGKYSDILQEVSVPIWKHLDCADAFVEHISDKLLCAGASGRDSCRADSGGPLMMQLKNRKWVLIGLVTWGIGCGLKNRPGIYTFVEKYNQWILDNTV